MERKKKVLLAIAGAVVLCGVGFAGVYYGRQTAAAPQDIPQVETTQSANDMAQLHREISTPMQAYQENNLSAFESLLPNMESAELEQYLQMAANQQRADFVATILEYMPESWDASSMMEQAVRSGARHMIVEFMKYLDEGARREYLTLAVELGYPDLVELFYETLPDAEVGELAAIAYKQGDTATFTILLKGLGNTETEHFAELSYGDDNIAVFSRLALSSDLAEEYLTQATADGKTVFVNYLDTLQ